MAGSFRCRAPETGFSAQCVIALFVVPPTGPRFSCGALKRNSFLGTGRGTSALISQQTRLGITCHVYETNIPEHVDRWLERRVSRREHNRDSRIGERSSDERGDRLRSVSVSLMLYGHRIADLDGAVRSWRTCIASNAHKLWVTPGSGRSA